VSAREAVLGAVRDALAGADRRVAAAPRDYRRGRARTSTEIERVFVERVADYRATVVVCAPADVEERISQALPEGARVVVPPGLPWSVAGAHVDDGLSARALDEMDAVVTAATLGIAETGTIVLTHGPGEGRRALTLVPDLHVCVVLAEQVVAGVPDAFERLDPVRPTTWISGPSATSDIELTRVEGVHGPRTLHVVLVDAGATT
jgi:L-lactate dehydrogenase complex protein LldG